MALTRTTPAPPHLQVSPTPSSSLILSPLPSLTPLLTRQPPHFHLRRQHLASLIPHSLVHYNCVLNLCTITCTSTITRTSITTSVIITSTRRHRLDSVITNHTSSVASLLSPSLGTHHKDIYLPMMQSCVPQHLHRTVTLRPVFSDTEFPLRIFCKDTKKYAFFFFSINFAFV